MLVDGVLCSGMDQEIVRVFDLNDIHCVLLADLPWDGAPMTQECCQPCAGYIDERNVGERCLLGLGQHAVWEFPRLWLSGFGASGCLYVGGIKVPEMQAPGEYLNSCKYHLHRVVMSKFDFSGNRSMVTFVEGMVCVRRRFLICRADM